MKRNILLICAGITSIILVINSTKKIMTFRTTASSVQNLQNRLEALSRENEELKKELEYKKSDQFAEEEIRNKLGLVKKGEAVVIVGKKEDDQQLETSKEVKSNEPNWQKWQNLFFY